MNNGIKEKKKIESRKFYIKFITLTFKLNFLYEGSQLPIRIYRNQVSTTYLNVNVASITL